jgi:mono/diheme cytochrome c family protein
MEVHMLLTLMLLACGSDGKDTASVTADASAGATMYAQVCAGCHGDPVSGGGSSPLLADEVPEKSDAELRDIILNGEGEMPPVALSEQQVTDVIAYLRETIGG